MKKISVLLLTIAAITSAYSQSPQRQAFSRTSFWTETVINGVIKDKWRWQLDYQYRRMSDASDVPNGSKNLFKNAFQHVYRPWIHYQLNDNVRFSISPVGFWETFTPGVEAKGTRLIQPEYRICPQLTLTNKIGRVIIDQRYRYEFRYIGKKVDNLKNSEYAYSEGYTFPSDGQKGRARYFVRAIVPLGKHLKLEEKTFYIIAWNEAFIGIGKNTNNDKLWDQNRTFCLLGYKPKMKLPMRFEIGYGRQVANRFSSSYNATTNQLVETGHKLEVNNLLQVYVIFENFNKLFSKK